MFSDGFLVIGTDPVRWPDLQYQVVDARFKTGGDHELSISASAAVFELQPVIVTGPSGVVISVTVVETNPESHLAGHSCVNAVVQPNLFPRLYPNWSFACHDSQVTTLWPNSDHGRNR